MEAKHSVHVGAGEVASVILAAGKGSRMLGHEGNKTLLPLIPAQSIYAGERPLLVEVLENLPPGPKGIVVHHFADDVRKATGNFGASYLYQPITNGTGGAVLAALPFLESVQPNAVVITMGDVPLIRPGTYGKLVEQLDSHELVVLAFLPHDKARYGMLEMENDRVTRIVEWQYWHTYSEDRRKKLRFCNAGVYAARHSTLLHFLHRLAKQPHRVQKQREGQWVTIEEYFLTDLVELMSERDHPVGVVLADNDEVMGVDTPEALARVQELYANWK